MESLTEQEIVTDLKTIGPTEFDDPELFHISNQYGQLRDSEAYKPSRQIFRVEVTTNSSETDIIEIIDLGDNLYFAIALYQSNKKYAVTIDPIEFIDIHITKIVPHTDSTIVVTQNTVDYSHSLLD